jgi:hypothetical protein
MISHSGYCNTEWKNTALSILKSNFTNSYNCKGKIKCVHNQGENGQQMLLSAAVLMNLNGNTNRTVALAKLLVYLKLFNGASLAPQDCHPHLYKRTHQALSLL